jgi:hypothetical protein
MDKGKVITGTITDRYLDDEYQYQEWVNTYSEFIEKLVDRGGLSSDY